MIYQAFYHPEQEEFLFDNRYYTPVCLQPEQLSTPPSFDIRNTPPLGESGIRQQLCEFAAMLAVWRQRPHPDEWVGFTSWRQLQKGFAFVFGPEDLRRTLNGETIIWGLRTLNETLHQHAERCHPGMTGALSILLRDVHQERLPETYFTECQGPFCNYWAMTWQDFDRYMRWTWPLIETAMDRWGLDQPFNLYPRAGTQDRSLAFLHERLFVVWWLSRIACGDNNT
jgi:hypothetical protein